MELLRKVGIYKIVKIDGSIFIFGDRDVKIEKIGADVTISVKEIDDETKKEYNFNRIVTVVNAPINSEILSFLFQEPNEAIEFAQIIVHLIYFLRGKENG